MPFSRRDMFRGIIPSVLGVSAIKLMPRFEQPKSVLPQLSETHNTEVIQTACTSFELFEDKTYEK